MFRKQLDLTVAAQSRQFQFPFCRLKRVQMPRTRQKQPFALALPANLAQQRLPQHIQTRTRFRRQRNHRIRTRFKSNRRTRVQIRLAVNFNAFQIRRQRIQNHPRLFIQTLARIDQHQRDIRLRYRLAAAFDADTFDHVVRLAQTRCIHNMHRHTVNQDTFPDRITGRTRNIGNNRHFVARQSIQQARLAHIRRTDQHHIHALAQNRTLPGICQHLIDRTAQIFQFAARIRRFEKINVFLGKIQRRLNQHAQRNQIIDQTVNPPRKITLERTQCQTCRRPARRIDQIRHALRLRQIQFIV